MTANYMDYIQTPTLVLNQVCARRNIKRMAAKAAVQKVRFRPHFKTHQSAEIGEWFRDEGVGAITVSSLSMAAYFANHGWQDILVAFSLNLRELGAVRTLAGKVHLGLQLESVFSAQQLAEVLDVPVDVWLKIDSGMHRAGIDASDSAAVLALAQTVQKLPNLGLRGLLTHAGQTYHAHSVQDIRKKYAHSVQLMLALREELQAKLGIKLEVSVGDTPGCTLSGDLGAVDEIRPGNFVFYDAMMHDLGACAWEDVAVAVASPVVALHPARREAIVYGGSIHLSKEFLQADGQIFYGYAAFADEHGWQPADPASRVISLSQEHGIVHLVLQDFERLHVGDLLFVLPVHSCLAVDALKYYRCLDGRRIETLHSCSDKS